MRRRQSLRQLREGRTGENGEAGAVHRCAARLLQARRLHPAEAEIAQQNVSCSTFDRRHTDPHLNLEIRSWRESAGATPHPLRPASADKEITTPKDALIGSNHPRPGSGGWGADCRRRTAAVAWSMTNHNLIEADAAGGGKGAWTEP